MEQNEVMMVLRAIHALYGAEGPVQQRDANMFLIEFAKTTEAWRIGLRILCDTSISASNDALFFAANMLHAKARKEWVSVSPSEKPAIVQTLYELLQDVQNGKRSAIQQNLPILSKLCGLFAIAMCSVPDECRSLLDTLVLQAQQLLQTPSREASSLSLFLIPFARCVCEEMEHAEFSFTAKDAMEMHLRTISGDVVEVLANVILATSSNTTADALLALQVWMKRAGISLSRLWTQHPTLLQVLIETVGQPSNHVHVCVEILCQVFIVSEYPTASVQQQALATTTRWLLSLRVAYERAIVEEEEEIVHAITDVVATFCETYVDWLVTQEYHETIGLGDFMLLLGQYSRRQIASLTLEFWLLVQEIPVLERQSFYQHDVFVQLLNKMLIQCQYPLGEMDEFEMDDWITYRQGSIDVVITLFGLLEKEWMDRVLQFVINSPQDWRRTEVCFFLISCIAEEIRKQMMGSNKDMEIMMIQVFELLFQSSSLPLGPTAHGVIQAIGAKVLGQFGPWWNSDALSTHSLDRLTIVLQYLEQAIQNPSSKSSAAKAFMQVTTTCVTCLIEIPPSLLTSILHYDMVLEDKLLVVEGIVRVAANSPHSMVLLQTLLQDTLGRIEMALQASTREQESIVGNELQICSKTIRFLDAPHAIAGGKDITRWVLEMMWPHLQLVSESLTSESTANALFDLYGWSLQSGGELMRMHLGSISNLIIQVFETRFMISPLQCASIAVDMFGRQASHDPLLLSSFQQLIGVLSRVAFQHFTSRGVEDAPDVLGAFFELAYRFLLYCPAAIISIPEFPVLIQLARACLGNQDRSSTNSVIVFVVYLLQESRAKLVSFQSQIDPVIWSTSDVLFHWVDNILTALACTTPSVLYDAIGRVFMALWVAAFDIYGEQVASAVHQRLMQPLTHSTMEEEVLKEEDRQHLTSLWYRFAKEPTRMAERKFRALCGDFSKICRQQLTVDTLQMYEVDG